MQIRLKFGIMLDRLISPIIWAHYFTWLKSKVFITQEQAEENENL